MTRGQLWENTISGNSYVQRMHGSTGTPPISSFTNILVEKAKIKYTTGVFRHRVGGGGGGSAITHRIIPPSSRCG